MLVTIGMGNTELRADPRRVPKNNYIFEYPWNLVQWQNAMRVSLKKSVS